MRYRNAITSTILVMGLAAGAATVWSDEEKAWRAVPVDRLVIHYEMGRFTLVSQMTVTKRLPPSDSLPTTSGGILGFPPTGDRGWPNALCPRGT